MQVTLPSPPEHSPLFIRMTSPAKIQNKNDMYYDMFTTLALDLVYYPAMSVALPFSHPLSSSNSVT